MSTNVHSKEFLHIVGGQTIADEGSEGISIPPKGSGISISIRDVKEGEMAVIPTQDNIVIRNGNEKARATGNLKNIKDGDQIKILTGNLELINEAINKNRNREDISK